MSAYGYAGQILRIDLTAKSMERSELPDELKREYIGGEGINTLLFHEIASPGSDPLSPDNPLLIGAGPLVGTAVPASSKTILTTKSPQSRTILCSPTGELGNMLKYAGYDHLIITGKSDRPVYICIEDQGVSILEAGDLWGKDIFESTDILRRRHGRSSVAAIGPAGENLVTFALVLINKQATWGRGGAGAVFGSKNLKAIVVRGSRGIEVADPKAFMQLAQECLADFRSGPFIDQWTRYGLLMAWEAWMATGKLTIDNWGGPYPAKEATDLWGPRAYESYLRKGSYSCPSCPLGCKGNLEIKEGKFAGTGFLSSNPFAISEGFGSRLRTGDYLFSAKCYEVCNRLGMDLGSFSAKVEFLHFLYEKGVVGKDAYQGAEPGLGFDRTMDMLHKIAYRIGVGDVLAGTWQETVDRLGRDAAQYAVQIKGVDPTMDLRGYLCTENVGQLTSSRGGHAMSALSITIVPGRSREALVRYGKRIGVPDSVSDRVFAGEHGFHPSRFLKWVEDHNTLLLSLGLCNRSPLARVFSLDRCRELYRAATGIDMAAGELLANGGEKSINAERLFNLGEGFARKDDLPPGRWLTEGITVGGREYPPLTLDQAESLLDDYYHERGWSGNGVPEAALISRLGLESMFKDI